MVPGPRGVARAVSVASEPIAYAWPETPPTGLRKFNLGTIPASVTPPRTWRRAAWFAVGTAVFVVLALGFAAVRLVGNPRRIQVIDALPGQPSQQLLINPLPIDSPTQRPTTTPTAPSTTPTPSTVRPTSTRKSPTRTTVRTAAPRPDQPGPAADRPAAPRPVRTTTPPPRSTVVPLSAPATDPDQLGDRTEQYYAQVCQNPEAAYELTTGPMHAEGPEGIEQRYGDIDHIEVQEITIDPNWAYTRSVLKVVRKDGSTVTIQRELTFSPGQNPKISSDTAAR